MLILDDIRCLTPCYDPNRYLPEDWQGTLTDILNTTDCPPADRIWVVVKLMPPYDAREFSLWCLSRAVYYLPGFGGPLTKGYVRNLVKEYSGGVYTDAAYAANLAVLIAGPAKVADAERQLQIRKLLSLVDK